MLSMYSSRLVCWECRGYVETEFFFFYVRKLCFSLLCPPAFLTESGSPLTNSGHSSVSESVQCQFNVSARKSVANISSSVPATISNGTLAVIIHC